MNVLVINCGSSSLKFQLINSDTEAVLALSQRKYLQKDFARESELTEVLLINRQAEKRKQKIRQCLHTQRQFSS